MKEYQKRAKQVKPQSQTIEVINKEKLMDLATMGLLNLSIDLGFEALRQILETDVEELAGPKGKHNPNRQAYRHGSETTKVVLGGEKRTIQKPRVRSLEGLELPLPSLAIFQDEGPLDQAVLSKLLNGVSTRKYQRTIEHQTKEETSCTSKSETSRRFIKGLEKLMDEFFNRPIEEEYPVIYIDGIYIGQMAVIAALGVAKDGHKHILGIIEGATENHRVVKALLADLIERGLAADVARLFVIDGSKALKKAIVDTFGKKAFIQRCQVHKKRNVLAHLPKSEQANIGLAISRAYLEFDYNKAKNLLELIAQNLEHKYPDAAESLREGLEETLTVHQLKIPGLLRKTLSNTNPIESANSVASSLIRRVKNWQDGEHILRIAGAGFLEAEKGFRKIKGYKQILFLTNALHCLDFDSSQEPLLSKLA